MHYQQPIITNGSPKMPLPDHLKLNQVFCGNCVDLMDMLPDEYIDLTVTSPPYDNLRKYKGYEFDFEAIANQLWRITAKGGIVVWVVADATINGSETGRSFRQALRFKEMGFNLHDTMLYEAEGTGAKGSIYSYWQALEYMFVLSKGRPKSINLIEDVNNKTAGLLSGGGRYREGGSKEKPHATKLKGRRTNIWRYKVGFMDRSDKTGHPAPFPEQLAQDHIISWSNPGDIVLDPMCGSGTTLKMAMLTGRKYIGFDISENTVK